MKDKCEHCGHSGNGNKLLPIIMMVLVGGGAVGVSQGGDQLFNQALEFINQDITDLRKDVKSMRGEFTQSEAALDTKLQLEQRLLIDTIKTEINDLDRLLQVEINQGIIDNNRLLYTVKELEKRLRALEIQLT